MNSTLARKIRCNYDRLFKTDPVGANIYLLLTELTEEHGKVKFNNPDRSAIISLLLAARFDNPGAYQLPEVMRNESGV